MAKFAKTKKVEFSPLQMFDLVADVERYPEFLPMCNSLVVNERRLVADKPLLIAEMCVGYKNFCEQFTSQVLLDRDNFLIDVSYLDGPFKYLENRWRFLPGDTAESCNVDFYIDYKFKNKLYDLMLGKIFENMFGQFTNHFETRAQDLYG